MTYLIFYLSQIGTYIDEEGVKVRKIKIFSHQNVGFESLPVQFVNKATKSGFVFNILVIGKNGLRCYPIHDHAFTKVLACSIDEAPIVVILTWFAFSNPRKPAFAKELYIRFSFFPPTNFDKLWECLIYLQEYVHVKKLPKKKLVEKLHKKWNSARATNLCSQKWMCTRASQLG